MPFVVIIDGAEKGPKFPSEADAIDGMRAFYGDMSDADYEAFIKKHIKEV